MTPCRVPCFTPVFTTILAQHPVILSEIQGAIVTSAIVPNLANINDIVALRALFGQFRIVAARVVIIPQDNASGFVTNSTTPLVDFYSVIDYDVSTSLTVASTAHIYESFKIQGPGESAMRVFQTPLALADSEAFIAYADFQPIWIDCALPVALHYGMKCSIPQYTATQRQLQSFELDFEYFFQFRSVI